MPRRLTKQEFIEKAKKVHGNNIDFSKVIYINNSTKVKLICNICGHKWEATPSNLLSGYGCPKCGIEKCAAKKRISKEEFLKRARKVHGDVYKYDLNNYKKLSQKITIKCKTCGNVFTQRANDHVRGQGCPVCGIKKRAGKIRLKKEEFIERAKKIHNNKYNYSKVNYINYETKVEIICPKHGSFWQTPHSHLRGNGCPKCSLEKIGNLKRKPKEIFIQQAIQIHGDNYDYSLVEYVNSRTKVKIICNRYGRVFEVTLKSHLKGAGCKYCNTNIKDTRKFIKEAKKVHNNKYDYSLVDYKGCFKKVKIKCNVCGKVFNQAPHAHLQGQGCPHCAKERLRMGLENFIKKARKIHNGGYDYSMITSYVNNKTKVPIKCNVCGVIFYQTPNNHLRGEGCPRCSKTGIDLNKPVVLYYVKIIKHGKVFYKIGITNGSVKNRFIYDELDDLEVVKTWYFEDGNRAYKLEQRILDKFKNFRYKKKDILRTGNTELFVTDLFNEITKEVKLCQ